MNLIYLVDEDFVNYKKPSMFVGFPHCTCKCDKEYGKVICQNHPLLNNPLITITKEELCERYLKNEITSAIVIGGLEPFEDDIDLISFVDCLRNRYKCNDTVVIYTGYTEQELKAGWRDGRSEENETNSIFANLWNSLIKYPNIIVKFGRYIPDMPARFDEVLGVKLASENQYAKEYNMQV